MAILDRFDRAELGSNWESPAKNAADDDGPLIMIDGIDGVEMNPIDVNGENCSGIYIGEGEFPDQQYAEVELIDPINFHDFAIYQADFANIGVMLNTPLAAANTRSDIIFRIFPNMGYTAYDEFYWDLAWHHATSGAPTFIAYGYLPPSDFFEEFSIPVGTKIRLERIGNTYTCYLYSPYTDFWHKLGGGDYAGLSGGYPGIEIYSTIKASDARVSNFRAGGLNDTFLGGVTAVAAQIKRASTRSLVRDLSSDISSIRNVPTV